MKHYILAVTFALCNLCFGDWSNYKLETTRKLTQFVGEYHPEQISEILELIRLSKPVVSLDIGVLGGGYSFAIARGLQFNKKGFVYSVDTWNPQIYSSEYTQGSTFREVDKLYDLDTVYKRFKRKMIQTGANKHCAILRMTTEKVAKKFEANSIHFLHINGDRGIENIIRDVEVFLPKIKKNGYVLIDNLVWVESMPHIPSLLADCDLVDSPLTHFDSTLFKKR